jgi:transposase-like protein
MRRPTCIKCHSNRVQRRGFFFARVMKSYRRRYFCLECKTSFSNQTTAPTYRQKRPDLNTPITKLLTSGMAQRQIARYLGCSKNTVDRKLQWLSLQPNWTTKRNAPEVLFIDEMESIEHTKLKPLTIPIAVGSDYRIYSMTVGRIKAKGHLAVRSKQKYGQRLDEKLEALHRCFQQLIQTFFTIPKVIRTDESPIYKNLVRAYFPNSKHETYSSRDHIRKKKEMVFLNHQKKIFDPLFALNQRCAKLRQDIRRLSRRSWCTTKSPANLEKCLSIYIANQTIPN